MQAPGTLEIPILRYSLRIINRHQEKIHKLDRKNKEMLTIYLQHHARADIDRLCAPRKEGRRELISKRSLRSRNYEIDGIYRK
jgi:hypothetical protein